MGALSHVRAFSFAFGSLGGTSTRSSFLVRLRLTWGHFHTFELFRSPSAHSGALPHVRAFSFAFGSLRGHFHTFELSRLPSALFGGTLAGRKIDKLSIWRP